MREQIMMPWAGNTRPVNPSDNEKQVFTMHFSNVTNFFQEKLKEINIQLFFEYFL